MNHSNRIRSGVPGLSVQVINDNFEKALRIFNKKVQNSGLIKELKSREFYEKPSIKKRRKRKEAILKERNALK